MAEVTTIVLDKILLGDATTEAIEKANDAIAQAQADANTVVTHGLQLLDLDTTTQNLRKADETLTKAIEDLEDDIAAAGKVDDVKVNGASVVTNKVANITVPTYLSDLNDDMQVLTEQMLGTKVASLDTNGKVPSSQLPSFVDDVLEYDTLTDFPDAGEYGKIYVAIDTNKTYRFSGSQYTEISASLALGTVEGTAYSGAAGAALAGKVTVLEQYTARVENQNTAFPNNTIVVGAGDKKLKATDKRFVESIEENEATDIAIPTEAAVVSYVKSTGILSIDVTTDHFSSITENGLTTFTTISSLDSSAFNIIHILNNSGRPVLADGYIDSNRKVIFTVASTKASTISKVIVQRTLKTY